MAVLGPPEERLGEALDEIAEVQKAARAALRPGVTGAELYAAAEDAVARSTHRERTTFLAHGIGLVSHEAPRLTDSGPVRYPATHRHRPFEPGMVLSLETDVKIEDVGFVKIEETVAVTETGHETYGDGARDWIVVDA
jgi:Xaa-Pro aminopeptidase